MPPLDYNSQIYKQILSTILYNTSMRFFVATNRRRGRLRMGGLGIADYAMGLLGAWSFKLRDFTALEMKRNFLFFNFKNIFFPKKFFSKKFFVSNKFFFSKQVFFNVFLQTFFFLKYFFQIKAFSIKMVFQTKNFYFD